MVIKAKIGFCGVLCMAKGEIREYDNKVVLADLLRAGYIEEIPTETEKNQAAARKQRKVKADESKPDTGK